MCLPGDPGQHCQGAGRRHAAHRYITFLIPKCECMNIYFKGWRCPCSQPCRMDEPCPSGVLKRTGMLSPNPGQIVNLPSARKADIRELRVFTGTQGRFTSGSLARASGEEFLRQRRLQGNSFYCKIRNHVDTTYQDE